MTKENKYVVVGGQYYFYYYGSAPTLLGAKRIAGKNVELWDNWQGFHVPAVYRIEDTVINCNGHPMPKLDAIPVASAHCETINHGWGQSSGRIVWESYEPDRPWC